MSVGFVSLKGVKEEDGLLDQSGGACLLHLQPTTLARAPFSLSIGSHASNDFGFLCFKKLHSHVPLTVTGLYPVLFQT